MLSRVWLTLRRYWLPLLIVAVAVASGGHYLYTTHCQSQFVQDYRDTQSVRAQIAEDDRDVRDEADANMVQLIRDILDAGPGDDGRRILNNFLARQGDLDERKADLERQRAATPFPDLEDRC